MSTAPSRNDPCPCGSGRKYKKCCGAITAPVVWTDDDREEALERLFRFVERPEWDAAGDAAWRVFWPPGLVEEADADVARDLQDDDTCVEQFVLWLALDRRLEDGSRLVDRFLARERHRLTPGGREFVARLAGSQLRLYEVTATQAGHAVELRDVLGGTSHRVPTPEYFEVGDLIAARLVPDAAGRLHLDGALPYIYAAAARAAARAALEELRERVPDEETSGRLAPLALHWCWVSYELAAEAELRTGLANVIKRVYRVHDRDAMVRWLSTQPGLVAYGDELWTWRIDSAKPGERLMAHLRVGPRRVVVRTFTPEATARTSDWLARAPAGVIEAIATRERESPSGDDAPARDEGQA